MRRLEKLSMLLAFLLGPALTACGAYTEEEQLPRGAASDLTSTTSAADTGAVSEPGVAERAGVHTVAACIAGWNRPENAANQKAVAARGRDQDAYVGLFSSTDAEPGGWKTYGATFGRVSEPHGPRLSEGCVLFVVGKPSDGADLYQYRWGDGWSFVLAEGEWQAFLPYAQAPPPDDADSGAAVPLSVRRSVVVWYPAVRFATLEPEGTLRLRGTDEATSASAEDDPPSDEECLAAWNAPENAHLREEIAASRRYRLASVGASIWVSAGNGDTGFACSVDFHGEDGTLLAHEGVKKGGGFEWSSEGPTSLTGTLPPPTAPEAVVQPDGRVTLRE